MNIYAIPTAASRIAGNSYVGRGIIIGTTPSGKAVSAYFIMGRSENSRNRVFTEHCGDIFTEPYDPAKVEDPSLIIYAAVRKLENKLIVTNGDQTDTIRDALLTGKGFRCALATRAFEPDAPNFTPRISGMITFAEDGFSYDMSILKSIDEKGTDCARFYFSYPSLPGLGHFIHTYVCDGNPIPTFQGEPERVAIPEDIDALTEELWTSLDENNKISLYIRYTDPKTGDYTDRLINKNKA